MPRVRPRSFLDGQDAVADDVEVLEGSLGDVYHAEEIFVIWPAAPEHDVPRGGANEEPA